MTPSPSTRRSCSDSVSSGCRRPWPRPLRCLDDSDLLKNAMGDYLYDAFTAVRRAEEALFADSTPEQVVAATRWRY